MRPRTIAFVVALAAPAGCRDAVAPWAPFDEATDTTAAIRLTWSAGPDLYPTWTRDGDSVVYAGTGFPGLPAAAGLLLRVQRHGGPAALLIPDLQALASGNTRRFVQPAIAPAGDRIAFLELASVRTAVAVLDTEFCRDPEPVLDSAVLHVREPIADATFQASVPIVFPGLDPDQKAGLPGPWEVRLLPVQQEWDASGEILSRAAWSPDGSRLVFSDGLQLLAWSPGAGAPEAIPGTGDGLSPAWSPDGDWIAFTRWTRADSAMAACDVVVGRTVHRQNRWTYSLAAPRLILTRPDGTGQVDLGEGRDPAWSVDGSLFFRAAGRLRVRSGDAVRDVADTESAGWPAVSPDGSHLAFVRPDPSSGFDVWVVRIER